MQAKRDAAGDGAGIAIIGMACRFPGAPDRRRFWRNLCEGVESVSFFSDAELLAAGNDPAEIRHPDYVKAAFLLPEADRFDTAFFGYSPHEARLIDPQQRHLLEVSWEAFEDAGYPPGQGCGPVGVYAATGSVVTNYMVNALSDHPDARGRTASVLHIGNDKDFAATRVSFKLGLTGPSLNVQTACSTSLVLVHLACRAIRDGECDMALAAAATMRVPQVSGYLGVKGSVFSPDGHIRTFDAEAGGTVFASGVGAVLLKDRDRALADGDHIYAVIRGTAVNNDGARKASYAGTSVRGQAEVMAAALTRSGVAPASIGYVECHGTGTTVGDPREFTAVRRALGDGPRPEKCPIGSSKPNIGHPEQSAGLASLIKTALALEHGVIPPTINFATPNPRLRLDETPFFVNTALSPWPAPDGHPRRALVNSLGIGGTNAAAVMEQAPASAKLPGGAPRPLQVFVLSAKTAPALDRAVARHRAWLRETPAPPLADVCHTLAVGRTPFAHRFAAVVASPAELDERLAAFRADPAAAVDGKAPRRVAFLYSGQGAQAAGMGRDLYRIEPAFRAALDRVAAIMRPHLDRPLLDVLFAEGEEDASLIDRTGYTQPALFAVQVALAEVLGAWGIRPDAVAGHSIGEFAAAHAAGVFSLADAARLVCARGRLMQALPAGGAMAAVFADSATVAAALAALDPARIAVAALNAPRNTVISGTAGAVRDVVARIEAQGLAARSLTVSHAFHSPLMEPALDGLRDAAAGIEARPPAVAWVSTLTGEPVKEAPDGDYWARQARQPVRFAAAVRALVADGITDLIEVGPGKSLLALGRAGVEGDGRGWLPTLGRDGADGREMQETVATLFRRGHAPGGSAFAGSGRRRVPLPPYPFQRDRVWIETDDRPAGPPRPAAATGDAAGLAGTRLRSPLPALQFEASYGLGRLGWLADHRIHGAVVLPTTAGLMAALDGARAAFGGDAVEVADATYDDALVLGDDEERPVHLVIDPPDGGAAAFTLSSLAGSGEGGWRLHLRGTVRRAGPASTVGGFKADAVRRRCDRPVVAERYYAGLTALGLGYGPAFRGIQSLWRGNGEALARVRRPDGVMAAEGGAPHPAVLDACLHVYPAVVDELGDFTAPPAGGAEVPLPLGLERFAVETSEARELWVHARRRRPDGRAGITVLDIDAYEPDGRPVATVRGLSVKPLPAALFRPAVVDRDLGWLYRMRWDERPVVPAAAGIPGPATWLLLGGEDDGTAAALADAVARRGARCRRMAAAEMPDSAVGFAAVLEGIAAEAGGGAAVIVFLAALDTADAEGPAEPEQERVYGAALALAQALARVRTRFRAAPRLWLVTRNAVGATGDEPPLDVLQAGLWGFGRSLAIEAPATWGGLVDLDAGAATADQAARLAAHLSAGDGETQVAMRGARRLAARLVPAALPPRPPGSGRPGTWLVTGGLGALGLEVAAWLVEARGARTVVLASRQGNAAANAKEARRRLTALGAKVVIAKADTAVESDVRKLMARLARMDPPLRGIVHSAGVLADATLAGLDWPRFRRALAPKLDAAWFLHAHSRDVDLDAFVLFSSVLSLIGSAGQINYTTANACLDGLAAHRRRLGLPGLAVNWGPWAGAGLAGSLGEHGEAVWRARGMHFLPPSLGREACDALIGAETGDAAVIRADWPTFLRQFPELPRVYAALPGTTTAAGGLGADIAALRVGLAAADPADRRAALTRFLVHQVTTTLGLPQPVAPAQPLRELGLDSLMAVTLINRVETASGLRISTEALIRGPSIDRLVDDVWSDLAGADTDRPAIATGPAPVAAPGAGTGAWLVTVAPRAKPRFRLFCFPFAGGGSAAFQAWAASMDSSIEVIAVEPPGRLARIDEKPVRDMDVFVDAVLDEMEGRLDVPFALFGHCLGGLTLYEVTRTLLDQTAHRPRHLFCSGARPPDRVRRVGAFERNLARHLLTVPGYRADRPPYHQPDEVFAEIIRHFDMAATDQLLDDPELRRLMLPAVRAEFEMTSLYRYRPGRPWDIPITCFVSKGDPYVSRRDILGWGRFTNSRMQVYMREGTHYSIFEDAAFIQRAIARELTTPPT